jgi:hypothetical protein
MAVYLYRQPFKRVFNNRLAVETGYRMMVKEMIRKLYIPGFEYENLQGGL